MTRQCFMLSVGVFHLLFGGFFFFFTAAGAQLFIEPPGESSLVIVKGLSGICFAFGAMNIMARNAEEGPALTAILVGTLFYLLFTTGCDIYWIRSGILAPLAWASIALRSGFSAGYAFYLTRLHRTKALRVAAGTPTLP